MAEPVDIAVIGAGAWGTALAILYARAGRRTTLIARTLAGAEALARDRVNPRLPSQPFPPALGIGHTPPDASLTLLCPPFQHLRDTVAKLSSSPSPLVLCCKGAETATGLLGPEILARIMPQRQHAVLTGPNFAHEIAAGLPAAAVLATPDPILRRTIIAAMATPGFRLYGSADITGAALAGAAKNVIAIAAGTVIGAGLGENARAAVITRGLAEIARLAVALGGRAETTAGLAGLGDLILTATGGASRNYRAGLLLGSGVLPASTDGSVIEGILTAPALLARARSAGCDVPVTEAVANLLQGQSNLPDTMAALLRRDLRDEAD